MTDHPTKTRRGWSLCDDWRRNMCVVRIYLFLVPSSLMPFPSTWEAIDHSLRLSISAHDIFVFYNSLTLSRNSYVGGYVLWAILDTSSEQFLFIWNQNLFILLAEADADFFIAYGSVHPNSSWELIIWFAGLIFRILILRAFHFQGSKSGKKRRNVRKLLADIADEDKGAGYCDGEFDEFIDDSEAVSNYWFLFGLVVWSYLWPALLSDSYSKTYLVCLVVFDNELDLRLVLERLFMNFKSASGRLPSEPLLYKYFFQLKV